MPQKEFVKYVAKECFGCTDWDAVEAISPLLHKLIDRAPQHVPALAKALVRLHGIDLSAAPAAPNSEANFHTWIQTNLNMTGLQYLYNSPCYNGFLNRRFDKLLRGPLHEDIDIRPEDPHAWATVLGLHKT